MHDLTISNIEQTLQTSIKAGLSSEEVKTRQEKLGLNELEQVKKKSPILLYLEEFTDPLLIILIIAAIISFIVHQGEHSFEAYIILIIVGLNASFSFFQKERADKALAALKKIAAHECVVFRDTKEQRINAVDLVPGDVIVLNEGDRVPADGRLFEIKNLKVSESTLTGESMPVSKNIDLIPDAVCPLADRKNMVYSSTLITSGKGKALVTATGQKTEIGKISSLLHQTEAQKTPLQQNLERFAVVLGKFILVVCVFVFILNGPLRHPGNYYVWLEQFLAAIALAVAAIPEGLPLVVTSTLALGVARMAKKNAIIKKMHAIEGLGCTNTICTDKTGTLTKNEMTVTDLWAGGNHYTTSGTGYLPEGSILHDQLVLDNNSPQKHDDLDDLLKIGYLCNNAKLTKKESEQKWDVIGDPTEGCLLTVAYKGGLNLNAITESMPRVDELPFDSTRKRMSTIHRPSQNNIIAYMKGAIESVLALSTHIQIEGTSRMMSEADRKNIMQFYELNASKALRGLAFAYRVLKNEENLTIEAVECDMVFVGMQFMIDPPRDEVKAAIMKCKTAGINVKMITGDNLITAKAIAQKIGILESDGQVFEGKQIASLTDVEISHASVFARVSPEDKQIIVSALQNQKKVVAMTGDGVNDAPALKKADIGVAMGITGTDVSKEAAAMVLVDDNFATLVAAIEEGRGIYDNIKKFVMYLMTTNIVEVIVLLVASLLDFPLPLVATQILFINLIIDGPPAISLAFEPYNPDIMTKPPRDMDEQIVDIKVIKTLLTRALFICSWVLFIFIIYTNPNSPFATVDVPYEQASEIPWLSNYANRHIGQIPHEATWEALYLEWKARSIIFLIVMTSVTVNVYNCRSETESIFKIPFFNNRFLNYSVLFCIVVIIAIFWPNSVFSPIFSIVPLKWELLWVIPTIVISIFPIELMKKMQKRNLT